MVLGQAEEVVLRSQVVLLVGAELVNILWTKVFDCLIVLHLEALLLPRCLPLAVLALPLLIERAADKRLVHLLVGVVLVDVIHGWPLRNHNAAGCAQVVQLVLHYVGAWINLCVGLSRSSRSDALLS